jgi:hypothetical protein
VAKKTLRNFQVAGALFVSPGGAEIAAGDEVRLFLNQVANPAFPEFVDGIAQNPIARVNLVSGGCVVEGTSYTFEYEADDLDGAATVLNVCDVTDVSAIACCEVLRDALDDEIAARTAADTALQTNIDEVQDDLDTWDVLELTAAPVNGTVGRKQITTQTVIGTVATGGSMTLTVTAAGLTGSPLAISFNVDSGDIPSAVAAKAAAALSGNAAVAAMFEVDNIGADFALTRLVEAANDGTLNLAIANGTATGVTPDGTSTATQTGLATSVGTVAERIGRHAQFGPRVWEAIDTSPNTWREITTVLNSARHDPAITGLTGGGVTKLDGLAVTTTHDLGRFEIVDVSGRAYLMELIAGTDVESSPTTIRPDNYGATNPDGSINNLTWKLRYAATKSDAILDASTGGNGSPDETKAVLFGSGGGLVATYQLSLVDSDTGNAFTIEADNVMSGNRVATPPDADGTLALFPVIVAATPTTGFTITAARYTDQTHYLTPAGALANGSFVLPTAANSRAGQIVRLHSTEAIGSTSFTVTVSGGGTINGAALTLVAADTTYAWQCVSTAGTGTWIRLQ